MAIVGFTFTQLIAQKTQAAKGKININNNISIADISDSNMTVTQGKQALRVRFQFDSKYEPKVGGLHFEGEVILLEDAKVAKETLDEWSKKKSLPQKVMQPVLNNIFDRCNMQALIAARDIGLPPPFRMPRMTLNDSQEKSKAPAKKTTKK